MLVDRTTGYVQALKPLDADKIAPDAALTQSFLVQYVIARESFDIDTVTGELQQGRLLVGRAGAVRLSERRPGLQSPEPARRLPAHHRDRDEVKSVSPLAATSPWSGSTRSEGMPAASANPRSWVSVIRYRFSASRRRWRKGSSNRSASGLCATARCGERTAAGARPGDADSFRSRSCPHLDDGPSPPPPPPPPGCASVRGALPRRHRRRRRRLHPKARSRPHRRRRHPNSGGGGEAAGAAQTAAAAGAPAGARFACTCPARPELPAPHPRPGLGQRGPPGHTAHERTEIARRSTPITRTPRPGIATGSRRCTNRSAPPGGWRSGPGPSPSSKPGR